ncbi:sensor histidine kinase [Paenibacillus sp. MSJ-34]|uniref:cache domain-containing sensor histidine kinase n=1 Tax=Paenibacillus sp. MSJ-34 TaxID=2841529 RepID=UPI001C113439|nr:sensor histidine kinase [Paenibacillus sp. MSJ-34]MBU5445264.1 sensor histidine kinase [Paenibacillus sp. MSJ-34]
MGTIRRRIKSVKLRSKLMIVLAIFILAPLVFSGTIFYRSSSKFAAERVDRESVQVLTLVKNNVDQMLADIENRMLDIYDNQTLIEQLSRAAVKSDHADIGRNAEDQINRFLRDSLSGKDDIDSIYLMAPNEEIYFADIKGPGLFKPVLEKHKDWQRKVADEDGRIVWLPTYEILPNNYFSKPTYYFPVGMQVKDVTDAFQRIGILMMNVKIAALDNIVGNIDVSPNGVLLIADRQGNVIWHRNSEAYRIRLNQIPFYEEMISQQRQLLTSEINGEEYRIGMVHSEYNDWYYFSFIPQSDIEEQSGSLKRFFIVTMFVFALLFVLLAWLMTHYVTKPISRMAVAMKRIQKDNFEFRMQADSEDEIGLLQSSFNIMSARINDLIEEVKVISKQEKDAEVKALQAQINPHFVYNTLDAMNWIAIERGQMDISNMITSLSDMMRYAIRPGGPLVTIEEELKWAKNYAYLQEMRFEERFDVEFHADPSLYGYKVPRMLLQPYLENSILHGMEDMESGGKIEIGMTLEASGEAIRIVIRDNGSGIPEEKLQMIRERMVHGIGIYNLNDRLKLEYGPEFGVQVHSVYGQGTTITILIPAIR